jgi:hypothetical protein
MTIADTALNKVSFAKAYVQAGWGVFPLKAKDKLPLFPAAHEKGTKCKGECGQLGHGLWDATHEENMAVGWWDTLPSANIGIACGKDSGIVVLDVDAGHGGFDSLTELIMKHGALPATPVSKTGSGGEHIFFKHPGIEIRNSAGKLGKGLDIRGDGGYVVVPPSIHPNGNIYEWVVRPSQTEIQEMPEWMIELLKENNPPTTPKGEGEQVVIGERNVYLTQIAGSMRRKGLSEDSIFAALQIHNREKCVPPLPDGEILQISRSVSRYEPQDEPQVALPMALGVIEVLESEIRERQKNPRDVWGIHYAWPFLSLVTGGKQKGELIILAGEPGVGKSWWAHQDALFTAIGSPSKNIPPVSTLIWSGEMGRKQVYRRFFQMLGVSKRAMLTGKMSDEDWESFAEAKALVMNSPIFVSDTPLDLPEARTMLEREIKAHGIEQVVFDYDWLINSPGHNEIEQSQNTSRFMKQITREFDISTILISSVNKTGMDRTSENVTKSNVSGSGKKLHDADIVYIMTKFNAEKNNDMGIMPQDYDKIATLHITKGRELDYHLPNGAINYQREAMSPKFTERRGLDERPSWMK